MKNIIYERLKRQRLLDPIKEMDEEEYLKLFRLLQPVAPVHFTRPGDPPKLVHRTRFNDLKLSGQLREEHRLIKGRFAGGRVSYVFEEDLERYATAFRKTISKVKPIHEDILNVIKSSGGISKNQLKEDMDYSGGEITKALNTLQESFLVYEDQTDTDWDTGWFDFSTEWFELKEDTDAFIEHVSFVLLSYLDAMVFANMQQIKDWSQINAKILKQIMEKLQHEEKVIQHDIKGMGTGYIRKEDIQEFEQSGDLRSVFMLDKSDILVRSNMSELKQRYKGHEVLQYLLIDGEFNGAVLGHWRIGPYDVDDILIDLDSYEAEARKEEVIQAVRKVYTSERTAILKYNGEKLIND